MSGVAEDGGCSVGRPKLFADSMLGRLALWLRILGFDVAYEKAIDDEEIVERARREGRIILTRDTLLVKRRWVRENHIFIESDRFREQLREVVSVLGVDEARFLTRCVRCNVILEDVEKEEVKEEVPPYVYSTQEAFSRCPVCRRIYWGGTHRDEMRKELERILDGG